MEEKAEKTITPLEFVNYLEGFFKVIGQRSLSGPEVGNIMDMLGNVDKHPGEPAKENPYGGYYQDSPTAPSYFTKYPENICYCHYYNTNTTGEQK